MTDTPTTNPILHWDIGTAYELLVSLMVIHNPEHHGIRASWAAGVRSRIPAAERRFLEEIIPFLGVPLAWLRTLTQPKDAITLLWSLRQIPAAQRGVKVMGLEAWKAPSAQTLLEIAEKRRWGQEELAQLSEKFCREELNQSLESLQAFLNWWAKPNEFGEMLFNALQAYHQAFFQEEEKRVAPVLQAGLEHAQKLAKRLEVPDLLMELSQGVRLEIQDTIKELTIVPAYWTTPLVMWDHTDEEMTVLFGARPANLPAIPGEMMPDGLVRALKAIADPTRLKILRYLSQEELTPSELARRLHLRAPTLTHHLSELRLAGLVNLDIRGQEKHYATRREALRQALESLESFLDSE